MAHPGFDNTSAKVLNFILNSMPPAMFVSHLRIALDPAMGHTRDEFSAFIEALKGLGLERAVSRAQKCVQLSSGIEGKGTDTGHAATMDRGLRCHRDTCGAMADLEAQTLSLIPCLLLLCFLACRNPSLYPQGITAKAFELPGDSSFTSLEEGPYTSPSSNALGLYEVVQPVDHGSDTPFHTPRTSFEPYSLLSSPLPFVIDQLPPTSSPSGGNTEPPDSPSPLRRSVVGRTPSSTGGLPLSPQASSGDANSTPVLSTGSTVIPASKAKAPAQPTLADVPSTPLSNTTILSAPDTIATSPTGTICNDLTYQPPPTATAAQKASITISTLCSSPPQVTLKKFAPAAQSQDPSRLPTGTGAQGGTLQSSLPLVGARLPMPIFPNPIFKLPPYIDLSLTNTLAMGTGGTSHKKTGPVSPRLPVVSGAPVEARRKD